MLVAAARKETLLRLLAEHDQLVHEVERWSELAGSDGEAPGDGDAQEAAAGAGASAAEGAGPGPAVQNGPAVAQNVAHNATIPEGEEAN